MSAHLRHSRTIHHQPQSPPASPGILRCRTWMDWGTRSRGAPTPYLQGSGSAPPYSNPLCSERRFQTIQPFLEWSTAYVQAPVINILLVSFIVFPVYVLMRVGRVVVDSYRLRLPTAGDLLTRPLSVRRRWPDLSKCQ